MKNPNLVWLQDDMCVQVGDRFNLTFPFSNKQAQEQSHWRNAGSAFHINIFNISKSRKGECTV